MYCIVLVTLRYNMDDSEITRGVEKSVKHNSDVIWSITRYSGGI